MGREADPCRAGPSARFNELIRIRCLLLNRVGEATVSDFSPNGIAHLLVAP